MRITGLTFVAALSLVLGACGVGSDGTSSETRRIAQSRSAAGALSPLPADQEYVFHQGQTKVMTFPAFSSPRAETFFIWNLGNTIQHEAPYPSDEHGKLYAIFAPGPAGATHHVEGEDGFDHYHVVTQGNGMRTLDVLLVFPGANFDPATWNPPLSEAAMNAAVAAGTLAAPLLTPQAGFDPLVIRVPISSSGK